MYLKLAYLKEIREDFSKLLIPSLKIKEAQHTSSAKTEKKKLAKLWIPWKFIGVIKCFYPSI